MRLLVATPTAVVEDLDGIAHFRAEDETGAFGVLPGHADFVTVLPVSVVTWRAQDGKEGFVVVRGGVLTVSGGKLVEIAARGAIAGAELATLGKEALRRLEQEDEEEIGTRSAEARLHLAAIRQVERVLSAGREGAGLPPRLGTRTPDREAGA